MQQLRDRRITNTPTDVPQVRSNCGLSLNREETLSVAGLKTSLNNFFKCGCGQKITIKPHHKYYGIPDYINGHNKPKWTKESRQKLSLSMQKPKSEEWCKKHSESLKNGYKIGGIKPAC